MSNNIYQSDNRSNNQSRRNEFWDKSKLEDEIRFHFKQETAIMRYETRKMFLENISEDGYISVFDLLKFLRVKIGYDFTAEKIIEIVKSWKDFDIRELTSENRSQFDDIGLEVKTATSCSKEQLQRIQDANDFFFQNQQIIKEAFIRRHFDAGGDLRKNLLETIRKDLSSAAAIQNVFHGNRCKRYQRTPNHFRNCRYYHISGRGELCFCEKIDVKTAAKVPFEDPNGILLCENRERHVISKEMLDYYNKKVEDYDINNFDHVLEKRIIMDPDEYFIVKAAGIVPIFEEKDEESGEIKTFFLLGSERKNGLYRLFGGKREVMIDPDAFFTAIREFSEEIYGVFDKKNFSVGQSVKNLCDQYYKDFLEGKLDNFYSYDSKFHNFVLRLDEKISTEILGKAMKECFEKNPKEKEKFGLLPEKTDFVWIEKNELFDIIDKDEDVEGEINKIKGKIFHMDKGFLQMWRNEFSKI